MKALIIVPVMFLMAAAATHAADAPALTQTAKVLSTETHRHGGVHPVMNTQTGVITGSTTDFYRETRSELQIGGAIYIVEGRLQGTHVGDSMPAQISKHHRRDVVYLATKDKHGRAKTIRVEIVGQRVSQ